MFKPRRGRVSLPKILLTAAIAAAIAFFSPAASARAAPPLLKQGATGQRVAGLQWLLSGGRPSAYGGVRTLSRADVDGHFGQRTADAVVEMKRRLGWPDAALKPVAGRDLFEILTGKRARPLGWINRATKRLAAEKEITADRASTDCARQLIATEQAEIGVHEIPDGSNDSPRIRVYQSVTGAFRAPWCASFQMWALRVARLGFPKTAWAGAIADDSAGVFYIVQWARAHGWLRATPKPGYLVAFVDHLGHIGLVERVFYSGFNSLEGNASNQVLRRFHPFGGRPTVFIRIPGCAGG
jgi:hypothetical protein